MKGYPKSTFEIIDQSQIVSIDTMPNSTPAALYMQPYTSDKGSEDWEIIASLSDFITSKGSIDFYRHGQAQLTVAEALRSGAIVLGKRMVSSNATLANAAIYARFVTPVDENNDTNASCLYLYAKSFENCTSINDVCSDAEKYLNQEETTDYDEARKNDVLLFAVSAMGRGESKIRFRLVPNYINSRSKINYIKYSFEVYEDNDMIESIVFTLNPNIIIDDISQSITSKIKYNSRQIKLKGYDDNLFKLVKTISNTINIETEKLIGMDVLNGNEYSDKIPIRGLLTATQNKVYKLNGNNKTEQIETTLWSSNIPNDISEFIINPIDYEEGIALKNGSYGDIGSNPMNPSKESVYETMLLNVFGASTDTSTKEDSGLYDSLIYDLDAYKIDAIFDCGWSNNVKKAITDLVDFRGDMVFLCDLGKKGNTTISEITENINDLMVGMPYSNNVAIYHNYFNIINRFNKKEITVTMPYLLIEKLTSHIATGVGKPFAGIANNIMFNDIMTNSINFLPVVTPDGDQKQILADFNINYVNMYDGIPVMETMYVNSNQYTQMSYLHNIMAVQEIIKVLRTRCPKSRYTFMDGEDLNNYIRDVDVIIKNYSTNFRSIECEYMADEKYTDNNIFYAVLKVQFKNFIQEEYFKIIAIS